MTTAAPAAAPTRQPRRRLADAFLPPYPTPALEPAPVPEPAATILREIIALNRQANALPRLEQPAVGRPGSPAYRAIQVRIAARSRAFWKLIDV